MYPITSAVKALFDSESRQVLRITGGEKSPISKSVGPSAIASFSDAISADALNLSVDITPVQSGSGDPSPTNVRPISGWTGAKVTRAGKNLAYFKNDDNADRAGLTYIKETAGDIEFTKPTAGGKFFAKYEIDLKKGETYIVSMIAYQDDSVDKNLPIYAYTDVLWGNRLTFFTVNNAVKKYIWTPEYTGHVVIGCYISGSASDSVKVLQGFMIRLASETDETYEPYSGQTLDITIPTEAGTVYGGSLDVTTGLLTVTHGNIASYNGESLPGKWISSMDVYSAGGTPTTGAQVVYELATSIIYQLTPTQISLLAGVNNVWADCGDVTVEYATGYEYEINITDANVVLGSFNIDRYSCNGNRLEVGTAIAAEMTVKLDNHDGTYNGIVFEGTELFVEIGIGDPVQWMPCGYFTPDEQPRTANQITIHALDRMVKFDNSVPGLLPWTTETGEIVTNEADQPIYFMTDLVYPATIQSIIQTVCGYYNVPFTQSISSFPNYNYTISEAPNLQQPTTFRNIIQWCAGIMGTCAWIDWTGSLRFSWYGATTGYVSTPANRFSSDLHEDDVEITGVQYTNLQNYTVLAGRPEYTIDMTGNYLMAGNVTQILTAVNNAINGFTYRPFSATIINAPYLWPMDSITFTDKDGNDHTCILTNVNFGINGAMSIEGKGESMQAASRDALSGMTKEQGVLVEQAREATKQLDDSLTQEEIFNRLTDNGEEQGLILYNGKLYLNAEYIQAGTVAANLLMAAILTIGGANNGNGSIRILDGNGNVIGTWDKTGINVLKGTIAGPSVTLGGSNNESGVLTVMDGNGNVIGMWSKDGIVINDGTIIANAIKGGTLTLGGENNRFGEIKVMGSDGEVRGKWDVNNLSAIYMRANALLQVGSASVGEYHSVIADNKWKMSFGVDESTDSSLLEITGTYNEGTSNNILSIYGNASEGGTKIVFDAQKLSFRTSSDTYLMVIDHSNNRNFVSISGALSVGDVATTRTNLDAQQDMGFYIDNQGYICQRIGSDA